MTSLASLLRDPPPAYAFELSEAGIACARVAEPGKINFTPLAPGVLDISPAHDNLHQPQLVEEKIHALAPPMAIANAVPRWFFRIIARGSRYSISTASLPTSRSKSLCCVSG